MKDIKTIFIIIPLITFSCASVKGPQSSSMFSSKINEEEVVIGLNDYGLQSIPSDIGALKRQGSYQLGIKVRVGLFIHLLLRI